VCGSSFFRGRVGRVRRSSIRACPAALSRACRSDARGLRRACGPARGRWAGACGRSFARAARTVPAAAWAGLSSLSAENPAHPRLGPLWAGLSSLSAENPARPPLGPLWAGFRTTVVWNSAHAANPAPPDPSPAAGSRHPACARRLSPLFGPPRGLGRHCRSGRAGGSAGAAADRPAVRYAALSSSRACRRAPTSSASAPSMRTSSATTALPSRRVTVVRAGSVVGSFAIE
jgi:hypothetical protein